MFRIIGDDHPDDKKSIELGYTHKYNRDQMKWFRDYWKQKGQNVKESGNTNETNVPVVERCFKADSMDSIFCLILIFWGGIAWSIGTLFLKF